MIKIACWLIGQKDQGIIDDGPCDCHSLLFPARKLRRVISLLVRETQIPQGLVHPLAGYGRLYPCHLQAERYIFKHRAPGEEFKILEDHTYASAEQGQVLILDPVQVSSVDQCMPTGWLFRTEDHF